MSIFIKKNNILNQKRSFFYAIIVILPIVTCVLVLQIDVPFSVMLFGGGIKVFIMNLCIFVMFIYSVLFLSAIGTFCLPNPPLLIMRHLNNFDIELLRFFGGSGIVMFFGFTLGLVNLLVPWVTIPVFIGVLFVYFYSKPILANEIYLFFTGHDLKTLKQNLANNATYLTVIFFRFVLAMLIFYIIIYKGIYPNLISSDVMQLYFPYFAEVRLQQGIWLAQDNPIISDFLIGRGNGIHLFFASFTNPYYIQVLGVIFFVTIASYVYRVVVFLNDNVLYIQHYDIFLKLSPLIAAILTLTLPPLFSSEMGKYHMQNGAYLLIISFFCMRYLFVDSEENKWLTWMLLPLVVATPFAMPQLMAIIAVILSLTTVALIFVRGIIYIYPLVILISVALFSTIISLLFNYLYIGIAELNPWHMFIKYANLERLNQWSSVAQYTYMGLGQKISPFHVDLYRSFTMFVYRDFPFLFVTLACLSLSIIILKQYSHKLVRGLSIFDSMSWIFLLLFLLYPMGIIFYSYSSQHSIWRFFSFTAVFPVVLYFSFVLIILKSVEEKISICDDKHRQGNLEFLYVFFGILLLWSFIFFIQINSNFFVKFETYRTRTYIMIAAITHIFLYYVFTALFMKSFFASKYNAVATKIFLYYTITILAVLVIPLSVMFSSTKNIVINGRPAFNYFFGIEPLIEHVPKNRWDFARHLKIDSIVPHGNKVLPLNANHDIVPALNSPLIERGKVVHHYQSTLSRYYSNVMFGKPDEAYVIYRELDINYFYIQKNNLQFFGPGYSEAFDINHLVKYFDIFYEDEDFVIITWRGYGFEALDEELARYIDGLRVQAQSDDSYYRKSWLAFLKMREAY
jgi:hypothetical protein